MNSATRLRLQKEHQITIPNTCSVLGVIRAEPCVDFARDGLYKINVIGSFTYFGFRNTIVNVASIGRYCSFAQDVMVGAGRHPLDWMSTSKFFYRREQWKENSQVAEFYRDNPRPYDSGERSRPIGHDVWVGAGAIITGNVTIGTGSVIAANSTVTKDVPPYAIVGGSPAKVIRYRFDKPTIARLLASEWWTLKPEALKAVPFENIHRALDSIEEIKEGASDWAYTPALTRIDAAMDLTGPGEMTADSR